MADKKFNELDWVKIREELDGDYISETIFEKAKRKTRENPLVPIGKLTFNMYNVKMNSVHAIFLIYKKNFQDTAQLFKYSKIFLWECF